MKNLVLKFLIMIAFLIMALFLSGCEMTEESLKEETLKANKVINSIDGGIEKSFEGINRGIKKVDTQLTEQMDNL